VPASEGERRGERAWKRVERGTMSAAVVSLANACTIVDRALEVGRLNKLQPLTVVVLDAGGKLARRVGRSPLE
jgi:hypothetical protein